MPIFRGFGSRRGIHPKHNKHTVNSVDTHLEIPELVKISMLQHIGKACTPLVNVGDKVFVGQKIGECTDGLSAPIHSSVSGEVTEIGHYTGYSGVIVHTVNIVPDKNQTIDPNIKPYEVTNRKQLVKALYECGLVGLGGAGFPTHEKLKYKKDNNVDTLIINAAECEPYITSDYREMLESPDDIANGIKLIKDILGLKRAFIGIENNKPDAIKLLDEKCSGICNIVELPSFYPQGAEKVLIYNTTGQIIPEGQLPSDVGVLAFNITTLAQIYRCVSTGIPLISRRMTVDGYGIVEPKNLIVPIGACYNDLLKACNADMTKVRKVLSGGPMMGNAIYDVHSPITKTCNALICYGPEKAAPIKVTACIRCGRCINACPMHLMPILLEKAYDAQNTLELKKKKAKMCINCGCCSYICPAKRNLAPKIQLAKKLMDQKA